MTRTVLQVIRTAGTPTEVGYALLTLSHRPEVLSHGATTQDADGNALDTAILIEADDDGGNGARRYCVRLAGPLDALSSAVEGDQI